MKPPEEVARDLVREWLARADIDYRTALRLLNDSDPIRESIAFHCQQAAEKYLKAFLVRQSIEVPKTHSIVRLLDLVHQVNAGLAQRLADAEYLSPFGVDIRYPGDFPKLLPGQEAEAFQLATKLRQAILPLLDVKTHPD